MSSRAAVRYEPHLDGYRVLERGAVIGYVRSDGAGRWYASSSPNATDAGTLHGTRKAAALSLVMRGRGGHGGARPGAGRPPSGRPPFERVSVTMPPEVLERLDRAATAAKVSRSALLVRLLDEGLAASGYGALEVSA